MAIFFWAHDKAELVEVICDKEFPKFCENCKNRFICLTNPPDIIRHPSEEEYYGVIKQTETPWGRDFVNRAENAWSKDIHKVSRV